MLKLDIYKTRNNFQIELYDPEDSEKVLAKDFIHNFNQVFEQTKDGTLEMLDANGRKGNVCKWAQKTEDISEGDLVYVESVVMLCQNRTKAMLFSSSPNDRTAKLAKILVKNKEPIEIKRYEERGLKEFLQNKEIVKALKKEEEELIETNKIHELLDLRKKIDEIEEKMYGPKEERWAHNE